MKQSAAYKYGLDAEKLVANHYCDNGYKLTAMRQRTPFGEIDLIMQNSDTLVFIEVKARTNPDHVDFLTKRQLQRCLKAADYYINDSEVISFNNCRFDYVIVINGEIHDIFENISS